MLSNKISSPLPTPWKQSYFLYIKSQISLFLWRFLEKIFELVIFDSQNVKDEIFRHLKQNIRI